MDTHTPPAPQPAARPATRKALVVLVAVAGLLVGAGAGAAVTAAYMREKPAVGAAAAAEPAATIEPTTEAPSVAPPSVSDFRLTPKVTNKECFGSAGCNVTLRVDVAYDGITELADGATWLLVYQINGIEDAPQVGNLTLTGTRVESTEKVVSTASSKSKITLKPVSIEQG